MIVSPEARRTILVGAYEEDAVFDLLLDLKEAFGQDDKAWLNAIREEARRGLVEAYRYDSDPSSGDTEVVPVDIFSLRLDRLGTDLRDAVFLSSTEAAPAIIRTLPPPEPGDDLWITGFWGKPPEA